MKTIIVLSHPDLREERFEFDEDYITPSEHCLSLMEERFPDEEITGDIDRWTSEGGCEGRWFTEY